MKMIRMALGFMIGSLFVGALGAQTVQYVMLGWNQELVQTGPDASDVVSASATPYRFHTWIQGLDEDRLTSGTFTSNPVLSLPNGSATHNLAFNYEGDEWGYKSTRYATLNDLKAAFPNTGANPYTLTLQGSLNNTENTLPTTVAFPTIPDPSSSIVVAPHVTLTGGSWQANGHYLLDSVAANFTISFNLPHGSTPGSTDSFHYDAKIHDSSNLISGSDTDGFINYNPIPTGDIATAAIADLIIPANQLVDGNSYTLEINYEQVLANHSVLGDAVAIALYGFSSQVIIDTPLSAVPEPSTYAMILGALALAGVICVRRRKTAP